MYIKQPNDWNIRPYQHIDKYENTIIKGYNSTIYCHARGLDFNKNYDHTKYVSDWLNIYKQTTDPKPGDLLIFNPNESIDGLEYPLIAGLNGTALVVEDINANEVLLSQPSPFNPDILEYQTIHINDISKYRFITM